MKKSTFGEADSH